MKMLSAFAVFAGLVAVVTAAPFENFKYHFSEVLTLEKSEIEKPNSFWKDCGKSGDGMKVQLIKIDPDPPKRGQKENGMITLTLNENINGGTALITLNWYFIEVVHEVLDLCDTLKDVGGGCPLSPGTYTLKGVVAVPAAIPEGHYTGYVITYDKNHKELFCLYSDFFM